MKSGFLDLATPQDLLEKLRWEFENLQRAPSDVRIAYNFFVTAEHLPDWLQSKGLKNQAIPRVCSHLANGAKHFQRKQKHDAVQNADKRGGWVKAGWVQPGWVKPSEFVVTLGHKEAAELGKSEMGLLELAERTLEFWEGRFRLESAE